jgi:hypothetical protein
MGSPRGLAGVSRGSAIRVIPVRFLSFSAVRLMNGFEIANNLDNLLCRESSSLQSNLARINESETESNLHSF